MNFSKFDDIAHMPLRVYNRSVMSFNLMESFGKETVKEYFNMFTEDEQKQIYLMNNYMKVNGQQAAYTFATHGLELDDEESASIE